MMIDASLQSIIAFGARDILVMNLPPLGCTPAMLTLYGNSSSAAYDDHGCLSDLNEITTTHNEALGDQMVKLHNEYPALNLFYGDLHGVYTDILDNPVDYSTFKSNHLNHGLS
jgi:phospholipase/lecithinase/hemolysin